MPAIIPKALNPILQSKYLNETFAKEQRGHMHHALNTSGVPHRAPSTLPPPGLGGNPNDFYNHTWRTLHTRYGQAAGTPSALVEMARRHVGGDMYYLPTTGPAGDGRPLTGASSR
eukprot:CAMPEP_0195134120 /NCGR_PEP_ID=MMETSP0448-20130528/150046_1 /TAXON_ID=66468 /ORGANISM="Heterocapsa triquestra, Strain CCMP 448" /LENGTH=114 /DNA_ID=CAMNT_0040172207 /DNA_START=44 /DNA_END=385 /DNA_ORIENTATION=+